MLIRILAAAATAGDEAHDRPRYTAGRRPGALLSLFFFCLFFCNLCPFWFGRVI